VLGARTDYAARVVSEPELLSLHVICSTLSVSSPYEIGKWLVRRSSLLTEYGDTTKNRYGRFHSPVALLVIDTQKRLRVRLPMDVSTPRIFLPANATSYLRSFFQLVAKLDLVLCF